MAYVSSTAYYSREEKRRDEQEIVNERQSGKLLVESEFALRNGEVSFDVHGSLIWRTGIHTKKYRRFSIGVDNSHNKNDGPKYAQNGLCDDAWKQSAVCLARRLTDSQN